MQVFVVAFLFVFQQPWVFYFFSWCQIAQFLQGSLRTGSEIYAQNSRRDIYSNTVFFSSEIRLKILKLKYRKTCYRYFCSGNCDFKKLQCILCILPLFPFRHVAIFHRIINSVLIRLASNECVRQSEGLEHAQQKWEKDFGGVVLIKHQFSFEHGSQKSNQLTRFCA